MIKAFIFDLDGTLMDTEVLWVEAAGNLMRRHDPTVTRAEALEIVYGRAWPDVYRDILRRVPALDMPMDRMDAILGGNFRALRAERNVVLTDSLELLHKLRRRGPVCIVSGSPHREVAEAVRILGIAGELAFFLAAEDCGAGKPDPAGFLQAAARLGTAPAQCLVFEDSSAGVAAARAAGMRCVALARRDAPAQQVDEADLVLSTLADFDLEDFCAAAAQPAAATI